MTQLRGFTNEPKSRVDRASQDYGSVSSARNPLLPWAADWGILVLVANCLDSQLLSGADMAEKKSTFPMLPVGHWWGLRNKFKQSIPGTVTAGYLATVLNMQETSARANVLPFLRTLGIIDDEGKTLDRAKQWRDDHQYPDVCRQMREELYPEELLHAVPGPTPDIAAARRWFANHTGAGVAAVSRMATLYMVLVEADPAKQPAAKKGAAKQAAPAKKAISTKAKKTARPASVDDRTTPIDQEEPSRPGIHINLQVHISSDATPDQIDKIFESMAKHIYRKG